MKKLLLLIAVFTLMACTKDDVCDIYQRKEGKGQQWKIDANGNETLYYGDDWTTYTDVAPTFFSNNCADDGKVTDETILRRNVTPTGYLLLLTRKICYKK